MAVGVAFTEKEEFAILNADLQNLLDRTMNRLPGVNQKQPKWITKLSAREMSVGIRGSVEDAAASALEALSSLEGTTIVKSDPDLVAGVIHFGVMSMTPALVSCRLQSSGESGVVTATWRAAAVESKLKRWGYAETALEIVVPRFQDEHGPV